jgi:RNA polymerase sigma-70 factor (ECF subfamily)
MDGRIIRNFAHYYIMYRTTNNNDIDKMRRLYEQFYDRLFLYARTFLDDVEESRDVVSETFQTVWERWQNDVRDPGSSYLYTIVRNRCLDRLRRSKASINYREEAIHSEAFSNDEEVQEFEKRVSLIHQAAESLDEPGRTILRCTYYDKLTYRETAEKLGISENMVHKHMLKVFKQLRKLLSKELLNNDNR